MAFSIEFLDQPHEYLDDDASIPSAIGRLTIGSFAEEFAASLDVWKKADYESQWHDALLRLITGEDRSALIVYFAGTEHSENIEWWPMYRMGETVFLRNQLPWLDSFRPSFSIANPYASIKERQTNSENGETISEWSIHMVEIEKFFQARYG